MTDSASFLKAIIVSRTPRTDSAQGKADHVRSTFSLSVIYSKNAKKMVEIRTFSSKTSLKPLTWPITNAFTTNFTNVGCKASS